MPSVAGLPRRLVLGTPTLDVSASSMAYFADAVSPGLQVEFFRDGYAGFVKAFRKAGRGLSRPEALNLAARLGHDLGRKDLAAHECGARFFYHEASVPAVASYLGLPISFLQDLFSATKAWSWQWASACRARS